MGSINLGAIALVLLVGLWLFYAVPLIAKRRLILSEVEKIAQLSSSSTAKNLTAACKERSELASRGEFKTHSPHHAGPALRAKLSSGANFEAKQSIKAVPPKAGAVMKVQSTGYSKRTSKALTAILILLAVSALLTGIAAIFNFVNFWVPLTLTAALVGYVATLRLAKENLLKSSKLNESETAEDFNFNPQAQSWYARAEELLAESSSESEDSEDLSTASRHASFMQDVYAKRMPEAVAAVKAEFQAAKTFRYGSVSPQTKLEAKDLENLEANDQLSVGNNFPAQSAKGQVIGHGMTVDEILQRRRA